MDMANYSLNFQSTKAISKTGKGMEKANKSSQ